MSAPSSTEAFPIVHAAFPADQRWVSSRFCMFTSSYAQGQSQAFIPFCIFGFTIAIAFSFVVFSFVTSIRSLYLRRDGDYVSGRDFKKLQARPDDARCVVHGGDPQDAEEG